MWTTLSHCRAVCVVSVVVMVTILLPSMTTGATPPSPEWRVYTTENSGLPGNEVIALVVDDQGAIWVGTRFHGLAVYRKGGVMLPAASVAQQSSAESPATDAIQVTKDIVYAVRPEQPEWPEEHFTLDVYAPAQPRRNQPVVVYLGGLGGKKEYHRSLMRTLAEQGIVAVSINYHTIHPRNAISKHGRGFREMAETAACAIRFAHKKALDGGSHATQMILVGFSLGGGLAAQLALGEDEIDRQWEEFASRKGGPPRQVQCNTTEGPVHVDALVGIAGTYDAFVGYPGKWERDWLQASDPDLWEMFYSGVGKNLDLKVRLLHGEHDSAIPLENSSAFEAVLLDAGYDVELVPFDGDHFVRPDLTIKAVLDVIRDGSGNE